MINPALKGTHQRIGYRNGQILISDDLRDDLDFESGLRALHVLDIHTVWGVALGFQVSLAKADKGVMIWPGVAYDIFGREIVLWIKLNSKFEPGLQGLARRQLTRDFIGPFLSIESPSQTGFLLRVMMAVKTGGLFNLPKSLRHTVGLFLPMHVNWIGIDPSGGYQPPIS